jgi:hypothetical protein
MSIGLGERIIVLIIFPFIAQMESEDCFLFPHNREEEFCLDRELSLPPLYPFVASSELFSPHIALSQWHDEIDTCQRID